jgi:hypothetical protein
MDLTVGSDNTVSGTIVFALNKQLIELSGQSAEDLLGSAAPVPSDVEGVTSDPYEDDEFQGQRFTFDGVPLAEFNDESGDADQLRIQRQGDTFVVSGALDLSSTGATGASGFPGAEEIFRSAQMQITLTFPGEVTRSNGQVDGNSVTWVPKVGERLELQATASAIDSGGSGSTMTILLIVAGLVIVAAIVIGVVVSKRRGQPATATAGAPGEPMAPPVEPMGAAAPTEPAPPAAPPVAGSPPPPPPPPSEPQP